MNQDSKKYKKGVIPTPIGPCGEYTCSVCVFTKSQAPGNPYDLKNCPKYNAIKGSGKADEKTKKK